MAIDKIILGIGNVVGHIVSAGLAVDAMFNVAEGDYQMAAVEAILSGYIQFSKYMGKKKQRQIARLCETAKELEKQAKEVRQRANARFHKYENGD